MLVLATVLGKNLGVWYNLAYMDDPYDARDSCNAFVHGIFSGRGGSCVSMPVFVAAIGRRLGYPIRLVHAKCHTFCRWEDPKSGERFNIDASASGYASHPDSYYMEWPYRIDPVEVDVYRSYLVNLTPRDELAAFFYERGMCWFHHLEIGKSVEAFHAAYNLHKHYGPPHQMWAVSLIVHRVFGPRPTDFDELDPLEISRRSASPPEFCPKIIRHAQYELQNVVVNWRTRRSLFPKPRLSIPAELSPQFNP